MAGRGSTERSALLLRSTNPLLQKKRWGLKKTVRGHTGLAGYFRLVTRERFITLCGIESQTPLRNADDRQHAARHPTRDCSIGDLVSCRYLARRNQPGNLNADGGLKLLHAIQFNTFAPTSPNWKFEEIRVPELKKVLAPIAKQSWSKFPELSREIPYRFSYSRGADRFCAEP